MRVHRDLLNRAESPAGRRFRPVEGPRPRIVAASGFVLALALTVLGCGGSDGDGEARTATSDTDERVEPESTDPTIDKPTATDTDAEPTTGEDEPSSGSVHECDEIFTLDEIATWFGEPAEVTEDVNDSIGQLVCTWETIEDPASTDDLAFQLITAQVFLGDPIPAANFIDPSQFDDAVMLDGIGDLAFSTDSIGLTLQFLDEPIAGSFSYSDVNMGDADAPSRHTRDEVEALFRQFHARVAP